MRISDWSSDVCSSDLQLVERHLGPRFSHAGVLFACLGRPLGELVIATRSREEHNKGRDQVQPVAGFDLPQAFPRGAIDSAEVAPTPFPSTAIDTDCFGFGGPRTVQGHISQSFPRSPLPCFSFP